MFSHWICSQYFALLFLLPDYSATTIGDGVLTHKFPDWKTNLQNRFLDRVRHRLVPLDHVIQRFRSKPIEYHSRNGKERLLGPISKQIEVCRNAVADLPCYCDVNEKVVDCSNESLVHTNLKPSFGTDFQVRRFEMRANRVIELWNGTILPGHEETLEVLDLSRNAIVYIGAHAFKGMNNLKILDLSHNRLAHFSEDVFVGADGLEWALEDLFLENNGLRKLDDGVFDELTMLKRLVLDDNPTILLSNRTFGDLTMLKQLSLENCGLQELPPLLFSKLKRLSYLSLRSNPLVIVPTAVRAIRSLTTLDMSATFITELNENALVGDYKLQHLSARDMPFLWAIEDCAFCGLEQLLEIVFFNCSHLYVFDENAFGAISQLSDIPPKLKMIDIEKCNISHLSDKIYPWSKVETLKLGGNPYVCDCQLAWMSDLEQDLTQGDHTPACASPISLRGRPLNVLLAGDICASESFRISRLSVLLVSVILILIVTFSVWFLCNRAVRKSSSNKLKFSNLFYKPPLPDYAYSNLIKDDEVTLSNYAEDEEEIVAARFTLPPPEEV